MKLWMQPQQHRMADRGAGRLGMLSALVLLALSSATLLDTVAWFRLERRLDRSLTAFVAEARSAGWHVDVGAGERGGWPFLATLTLVRPGLSRDASGLADGFGWSGGRVVLGLSPLHPDRPTLSVLGTQTLSWGAGLPTPILARLWGARIALALPPDTVGASGDLLLQADGLHVAASGAGPDDIAQVAEATARLAWRLPVGPHADQNDGSISLSVQLRDVALPVRFGEPAGRVVQRARLEARLSGLPGGRLPSLWQSAGERLRIDEASIDWGSSGAAMAGSAWPEPDGAVQGRFDLALTDPGTAVLQLQQAGLVRPAAATAIGAVIGLVAAGDAAGGRLHLPLSLRHGVLGLGDIPLLRLPLPGLPP